MKAKSLLTFLLLLALLILSACSNDAAPSSSAEPPPQSETTTPSQQAPIEAPESATEPSSAQTDTHPAKDILTVYEDAMQRYYVATYLESLESPVVESLGEILVEGETWYKFRLTTIYLSEEHLIEEHLINVDGDRLYRKMRDAFEPFALAPTQMIQECYMPLIEPIQLITDEEEMQLSFTMYKKIVQYTGDDKTIPRGIVIANGEFMMMLHSEYGLGDEFEGDSSYIETYVMSLDGERLYKLGDDGFFDLLTDESNDNTGYAPSELLGWQADPDTLDPYWVIWEHLEYRLFGDPENYVGVESEFVYVRSDGGLYDDGIPPITVLYRLSPIFVTQENSLCIDLKFSNGTLLKAGELPTIYYELQAGENPFDMSEGIFARNELIQSPSESPSPAEIVTQDNIIGGVWQTDKFIRGISGAASNSVTQYNLDGSADKIIDFPPNNTVQYYILLDENTLGTCFFRVSPQATADDLRLYDAIVESMRIISQ